MEMTPAQQKAMMEAAMASKKMAELARPKSGEPGPFMPVMGGMPELSPAEKAANKKELDAKIKAHQPAAKPKPAPAPTREAASLPRVPAVRKFDIQPAKRAPVPMEQVEIDKANKLAAMPQSKMPQPGTMPQANIKPQAQMAAAQKMPQPGTMPQAAPAMKRGGKVRDKSSEKFSSGGSTGQASKRGDGIAQRGKTKGRYI